MNFGDILNKWERSSSSADNTTMEKWLKNNSVYDKDADVKKKINSAENRRRLLHSKPDDIIDIHGLIGEEAKIALDHFFSNAKANGYKKLRIIHGKGNHSKGDAILGTIVRKHIEKCPFAGESGHEKAPNGGSGATWVFLK